MPGSSGQTGGVQTKLYAKTTSLAAANAQTFSGLNGSGKLVDAANEVMFTAEIADQEQTANNFTYTSYGEDTERQLPLASSFSDFSFAVWLDNTNALHKTLMGLANGADIELAVVQQTSNTNITIDYIRGKVSSVSKSTPVDAAAQGRIGVALSQNVKRLEQS